jgi:hypothetical protein
MKALAALLAAERVPYDGDYHCDDIRLEIEILVLMPLSLGI